MYDTNLKIETARLLLRQPRLEELDDWSNFMLDAESMRFIGGGQLAWHRSGLEHSA